MTSPQPLTRFIRLKELIQRVGMARATIYDRMNPKSPRYDATFPKSIKLSQRTVAWLESEVDAWIAARVELARTAC